jgi:hypothetical protein
MSVAPAPLSSFGHRYLLFLLHYVCDQYPGAIFRFEPHLGTQRDFYIQVLPSFPMHILPFTVSSVLRSELLLIPESKQSGYTTISYQVHAAPIPSISPVRTSQGNKLLPAKTDYTVSPITSLNINLNSVYQLSCLIMVLLVIGFIISIVGRTVKLIIIKPGKSWQLALSELKHSVEDKVS